MIEREGAGRTSNRKVIERLVAALFLATLIISVYSNAVPLRSVNFKNALQTVLLLSDHDFTQDEIQLLSSLGRITAVLGPVAVIRADSSALLRIQQFSFIKREAPPHLLHVMLDKSVPDIGAPAVWNFLKDAYGRNVTGSGVIIGFVDTGIDINHPDFTFPNGSTKILYVWDQTTPGRSPAGYGYGFECTSSDIQDGSCPEIDTFGHGTHIAGIAASSGRATGNYLGVAPGASIIFVKSGYPICNGSSWTFDDAHILDGIDYILKKAQQLGMRAVISLSLGGNIGGHDGTDALEQALDAIVSKGTPIVVAAGNQAQDQIHIHGQLSFQKNVTFNIETKPQTNDIQVDIWRSTQDEINATLVTPDGHEYSSLKSGVASIEAGNLTVSLSSTTTGQETYFEVSSSTALPTTGWKVTLTAVKIQSSGIWDSWLDSSSCAYPAAIFTPGEGYVIDSNDTIGIPGTAHNVLTVGAYVTKTTWKGMDGNTYGSNAYQIGQIAPFSSLGPTRDNRTKPDIVAPGMYIASARSSQIGSGNDDPDKFHRVLAGTSMAAPHVAGIIALMLQYSPNLSALQIANILRHSAREDLMTGLLASTGSVTWGFGKADARTATGFFRVSIVGQSLPPSITLRLLIDNNTENVAGGSWYDAYFLTGTTHRISIESITSAGLVRYLISSGNLTINQSTVEIPKFRVQYYLDVKTSPLGETTSDSGWYDANSTIRLSYNVLVSKPLGIRLIMIGWWTSDLTMISGSVIRLSHPTEVIGLYVLTYPLEWLGVMLTVSVAVLILLWTRKPNGGKKQCQQ